MSTTRNPSKSSGSAEPVTTHNTEESVINGHENWNRRRERPSVSGPYEASSGTPCPSCPFRDDNDADLKKFLTHLNAMDTELASKLSSEDRAKYDAWKEKVEPGDIIDLGDVQMRVIPTWKMTPDDLRKTAKSIVATTPKFACHHSVYDVNVEMTAENAERALRFGSEFRQCAGATKHYDACREVEKAGHDVL